MPETYYSNQQSSGNMWLAVLIGIVLLVAGFFGALEYVKYQNHQTTNGSSGSNLPFGLGQGTSDGGMSGAASACQGKPTLQLSIAGHIVTSCGRPTHGQVAAISSSSITVQPTDGSATQTFAITGSTQITDQGSTVSYSKIAVGDTVGVVSNTSDASQAQYIVVNPSAPNTPTTIE